MPEPRSSDYRSRLEEIINLVRAGTSSSPRPGDNAASNDGVFVPDQVTRITYHDFAHYQTVFDPWAWRDPRQVDTPGATPPPPAESAPPPPEYLPADLNDLDNISFQAEAAIAYFLDTELREAMQEGVSFDPTPIIRLLYRFRFICYGELVRHYQPAQVAVRLETMLVFFVEHFLAQVIEPFERMTPVQQTQFYEQYFDQAVRDWVIRASHMEMPWLLGHHTPQEWQNGGYHVGEVFSHVPVSFHLQNLSGVMAVVITDWAKDRTGARVYAHEFAWTHERRPVTGGHFGGGIVGVESMTGGRTTTFFAPSVQYDTRGRVTESTVLAGALQILAADVGVTPTELEALSAAARDTVGKYGHVLGTTDGTRPRPTQTPRERYGFEPYPAGSINLGIRVLYRQAWQPRGIQPGELVRTIPLAPGQKERFSVKYSRRNKVTRQFEETRHTETIQESVSQTKDSSEIVEEAAKSNKWHLDTTASGSFNMGAWGVEASTSAGYASESSKASKDTKTRLAEAMQKTARTSRREHKVSVSTEREESFETERSTEITNPNQEIAVTCFYETVQQIYTVKTALEGLDPVIFVAEAVPRPEDLTIDWVRRYDWILNRALLDESFRDTLQLVSTQHPDFIQALDAQSLGLDEVLRLSKVLEQAEASLATIHQLSGNIENTYEATLNAYQSAVATARSRLEQVQGLLHRVTRLIDHIADNILHYCRAIWSAEDPERRMMRYASLRMPTRFRPSINLNNTQTDPLTGDTIYTGAWEADPNSWRPLADIVHPAGPIAYAGNYAVYRIRYINATAGLSRVIRLAHQAYYEPVDPTVTIQPDQRAAALNASATIVNEDFYSGDSYVVRISNPPPPAPAAGPGPGGGPAARGPAVAHGGLHFALIRRELDGTSTDLTASVAPGGARLPAHMIGPWMLEFDGLKLTVAGGFNAGDEIHILPRPPILVDPEVKYRRLLDPQLSVDEIRQQIEAENTDDIVVDTNNLWLNLVKGTGTVLEDFKLEHRRIDVELARAELARRYLRLDQNILADPDIEKKVIIEGVASRAEIAAGEAVEDQPVPAPPGG